MAGRIKIFATRSMQGYAARVADWLARRPWYSAYGEDEGLIGTLRTCSFADGEMEVEIEPSIRGKDVFLFANAARNAAGLAVEESKVEMYHAVDALRRAQARRIILFEPYCSCGRSDRTTRRNSVGLFVHYKTLMSLGVDHILTYQLHSDKSRTMVDPSVCAIDDIPGLAMLKQYICDTLIKSRDYLRNVVRHDWLFCSVDAGGEGIARRFAGSFGGQLVIAHKQRDYRSANKVAAINILSATTLKDKTVWVVDDMIDTAGSVRALVQELAQRGVKSVNLAAVHAVLSPPACERISDLVDNGLVDNIVVSDTVASPEILRELLPSLHVVSSAEQSAAVISNVHQERPLSKFFEPFDAEEYLSSLKLFL